MTMPMQVVLIMLGFIYTAQCIFALIRLYETDTLFQTFKNYKSRREFWFWVFVPVLPLLCSVYLKSKDLPK